MSTQTPMWRHQYAGHVRALIKAKGKSVEDVAAALEISNRRAWSLWLGKVEWTVGQMVIVAVKFDIDLVTFVPAKEQFEQEVTC